MYFFNCDHHHVENRSLELTNLKLIILVSQLRGVFCKYFDAKTAQKCQNNPELEQLKVCSLSNTLLKERCSKLSNLPCSNRCLITMQFYFHQDVYQFILWDT